MVIPREEVVSSERGIPVRRQPLILNPEPQHTKPQGCTDKSFTPKLKPQTPDLRQLLGPLVLQVAESEEVSPDARPTATPNL